MSRGLLRFKTTDISEMMTFSSEPFSFCCIQFAPLSISMERRLQTLAVIFWLFMWIALTPTSIFILIKFSYLENFRWIAIFYLSFMIYDSETPHEGGRSYQRQFIRRWRVWKHFANYFPVKLIKTAHLDPKQKYLLGSHPHGILSTGMFVSCITEALSWSEKFPGIVTRGLTLSMMFWLPVLRELSLCIGACSASKRSMESLFKQSGGGMAAILVVGGATEALNNDPIKVTLYLNKRKGWIKLAIRYGVNLVPTFSFGEQFIFKQAYNPKGSLVRRYQDCVEKWLTFSPVIFFGRGVFQYTFGPLPYRKPINVVVGSPIHVSKVANPDNELIEETHAKYVKALHELYERYNPIYGDESVSLAIE